MCFFFNNNRIGSDNDLWKILCTRYFRWTTQHLASLQQKDEAINFKQLFLNHIVIGPKKEQYERTNRLKVTKSNSPFAHVLKLLQQRLLGNIKCSLFGDRMVGKSSLAISVSNDYFSGGNSFHVDVLSCIRSLRSKHV
jgi:hypothetical protein